MPSIETHRDFDASADRVWSLLNDFANIQAWWPEEGSVAIEKVVIEGDGLGMVRHIYNHGMPHAISERLDYLDKEGRELKLSIVGDRPSGILQYQAHGKLYPLDSGGCRMTYHSTFSTEPGREQEATEFMTACYELMFNGIEQAAQRG